MSGRTCSRWPLLVRHFLSLFNRSGRTRTRPGREAGGYRTDTLYCGNSDYGYRHLEGHIGEYFGGWASFSFAIAQTLKAPATFVAQENDNYQERAPIYQCFYAGYYIIWTFIVISRISSGAIVTAYGRPGRIVNESCP